MRRPVPKVRRQVGLLVGLAVAVAGLAAAAASRSPGAPVAEEPRPLDDPLARAQLEEELVLAEPTALLLRELEGRLARWSAGGGAE